MSPRFVGAGVTMRHVCIFAEDVAVKKCSVTLMWVSGILRHPFKRAPF